jgi:hypothetical protein
MAALIREIWEDGEERSVSKGLCLAGPDGESFRKLLGTGARCVGRFEAGSHFEAMTIYYRLNGWGIYTSDFAEDREPYPDVGSAAIGRHIELGDIGPFNFPSGSIASL